MNEDRRRRTGPKPLPATEKRNRCVSVRLNDSELAALDAKRGPYQRGEWFRMAALHRLPPMIPEVNRQAWVELSRSASNLNQIAKKLNEGDQADIEQIRKELAAFRAALIGTDQP